MIYNDNINELMLLIKHIMLDCDVSQKDIVNATNWSKSTVSNLLNGRNVNPSLATIQQLCNAMGCDLIIEVKQKKDNDTTI